MTTETAPLAPAPALDDAPEMAPAPSFLTEPDPSAEAGDPEFLTGPAPEHSPAPDPALTAATMSLLSDVELDVTVELGRCRMPLGDVARLGVGSVVELDTLAGEPLVVYVNGRRIATGEAVVVDGQFGIRITHLDPSGGAAA